MSEVFKDIYSGQIMKVINVLILFNEELIRVSDESNKL